MPEALILYLLSYLIGAIPFGLLACKIAGLGDIRKIGSGNIGATNVLRTGNKPLALFTLIGDTGKGAFAVLVLTQFLPGSAILAGFFAVLGHCYPVWLKFKGGKGVATTLGTLLAALPISGLTACVLWLIVAGIFRISSLAALSALLVSIIASAIFYGSEAAIIHGAITLLVWLRHKDNIFRLLKGEEPKIKFGKGV